MRKLEGVSLAGFYKYEAEKTVRTGTPSQSRRAEGASAAGFKGTGACPPLGGARVAPMGWGQPGRARRHRLGPGANPRPLTRISGEDGLGEGSGSRLEAS